MRVQSLEPLEAAAANVQRGIKVVLDRHLVQSKTQALDELRKHLKTGGKGEVRIVLPLENCDIEFELAGRYDVGPMLMGELSTLPGVLDVIET